MRNTLYGNNIIFEYGARSEALASFSVVLYSKVSSVIESTNNETKVADISICNTSLYSNEIWVSSDLFLWGDFCCIAF